MTLSFDPTKPVQTANKRKATIVHALKDGRLVVIVEDGEAAETAEEYEADGIYNSRQATGWDLINIPETKWAKIYRGDTTWIEVFDSEEEMRKYDDYAESYCIACIEFTEGEGLET